jgi:outer membrane protein assembly factor BamE (lipoprotein component of BamABCDE complex)
MKTLRAILYAFAALLFLVLLLALYDATRPASYRRRAVSIHPGDTRAQVRAVLGSPASSFSVSTPNLFFPVPERWMYGSTCDWRYWRHPFSSDFFSFVHLSPRDNDVVIDFDKSGIVQNVVIPQKRRSQ